MTISEKISKFFGGMDKVAHFGIGGLMCAMVTLFIFCAMPVAMASHPFLMMIMPFVGYIIVALFGVFKELRLDPVVDWKDVWVSLVGCVCVHIPVVIGTIVYLITE